MLIIVPNWTDNRSKLDGCAIIARLACAPALHDFFHDLLKTSADRGAIAPAVDNFQGVFKVHERPIDGPILWRTVGVLNGCRHRNTPEQNDAVPRACGPTFCSGG